MVRASTNSILAWNLDTETTFTEGVQRLEYNFAVATSPTSPPNDYGIVAVIDGSRSNLVTPSIAY